jgi:hypothetical protein
LNAVTDLENEKAAALFEPFGSATLAVMMNRSVS